MYERKSARVQGRDEGVEGGGMAGVGKGAA